MNRDWSRELFKRVRKEHSWVWGMYLSRTDCSVPLPMFFYAWLFGVWVGHACAREHEMLEKKSGCDFVHPFCQ